MTESKELVLKPRGTGPNGGRPAVYPDSTVKRALELMLELKSASGALTVLEKELGEGGAPGYSTLWHWAKQSQDVINSISNTEKRDMVALTQEVASVAAHRMIQAVPKLSDSQVPVAYGIAMQRRTDWENAGSKAPQMAVQFNFAKRGERD